MDLYGHGTAVWVAEGARKMWCSAPGKIDSEGALEGSIQLIQPRMHARHATLSTPIAMFGQMHN